MRDIADQAVARGAPDLRGHVLELGHAALRVARGKSALAVDEVHVRAQIAAGPVVFGGVSGGHHDLESAALHELEELFGEILVRENFFVVVFLRGVGDAEIVILLRLVEAVAAAHQGMVEPADHVEGVGDVDRALELGHTLHVRGVVPGQDAPERIDVRIGQDFAGHAGDFAGERASGELLRRHEARVVREHFPQVGQDLADIGLVLENFRPGAVFGAKRLDCAVKFGMVRGDHDRIAGALFDLIPQDFSRPGTDAVDPSAGRRLKRRDERGRGLKRRDERDRGETEDDGNSGKCEDKTCFHGAGDSMRNPAGFV